MGYCRDCSRLQDAWVAREFLARASDAAASEPRRMADISLFLLSDRRWAGTIEIQEFLDNRRSLDCARVASLSLMLIVVECLKHAQV